MKFSGIVGLAFYLGIGALFHAFMVGPHFDWSSAWTWGWLFGWPIMIFVAFWAVILGIFALCMLAVGIIVISETETVSRWRTNRMLRRAARKVKARQSQG